MNQYFTIILIFIQLFCSYSAYKLEASIEVSRHGARAPMYNNIDASKWNAVPSSLTNVGMRQHYLIGRQLQKDYIEKWQILPKIFNETVIQITCTGSQRTFMSAESQLLGLYYHLGQNMSANWTFNPFTDLPPFRVSNGHEYLDQLNGKNLPDSFQPIQIQSYPNDLNQALDPSSSCPMIDQIFNQVQNTEIYINFNKQLWNNGFFQRFMNAFNLTDPSQVTIRLVGQYYDTLYCDYYQQRPFPPTVTDDLFLEINFVYDFQQLYIDFSTNLSLILQASTLFKQINQYINDYINGASPVRFLYFSASDGSLNTINIALGIANYTTNFSEWKHPTNILTHSNVPFASTIFFEIFSNIVNNQKEYFIQFTYNSNTIQLKGCSNVMCPVKEFKNLIGQFILSDEEFIKACFNSKLQIIGEI